MSTLIEKSIDAYNRFLDSGHPPYVVSIYNFSADTIRFIKNLNEEFNDNLITAIIIKLISLHLNGKKVILNDDYVKLSIDLHKKFKFISVTSRPTVTELLNAYELSNEYEKSVIIDSFKNIYLDNGSIQNELLESVKDLSKLL